MLSAFKAKSKFLSLAFQGQRLVLTILSLLLLLNIPYILTAPDISLLPNIHINHSFHSFFFSGLSLHLKYCSHYPTYTSVTSQNNTHFQSASQSIRAVWDLSRIACKFKHFFFHFILSQNFFICVFIIYHILSSVPIDIYSHQ